MIKKYTIYADTHIGSKYLEKNILPGNIEQVIEENAYDVGDSFEMKNCEPAELSNVACRQFLHRRLFKDRYVSGNHACDIVNLRLVIDGHIMLIHGDEVLWSPSKFRSFRSEEKGQGSGIVQKLLAMRNGSLSKSEIKQLAHYACLYNCDTIVIGHVHPKELIDAMFDGIRVICCPRGRTELWL
jgi:predicted phosphodiesterase